MTQPPESALLVDEDDPDDADPKGSVAIFEGGPVVVKWNRHYFEPEDRTTYPVVTQYRTILDAQMGTGCSIELVEGDE